MAFRANVWDYGARPGTDCTTALRAAVNDAALAGGGHLFMPYGDEGDYYVQHKGGTGLPVAGYTGLELKTGVFLHGDEGTILANLPPSMGGKPGQVCGVRIDSLTEPSVHDCGLIGVTVRNDSVISGNQNCHAIWFHRGVSSPAEISGVTLEGVKVLRAAWGDGVYFGTGVSNVHMSRGSVQGAYRHGVTLAAQGRGRKNYLIEDVNLSETQIGSSFHIELGYDHEEAIKADDAKLSFDEIAEAAGWLRGVEMRRCHFSGNFAANGVAEWKIVDCTSRPRDRDNTGGGLVVVNSPRGQVVRSTLQARPHSKTSSYKLIALTGRFARDLLLEDSTFIVERCADGNLPISALYARQYSSIYPGWPSNVRVVNSSEGRTILLAETGTPIVNDHSGAEWDLSAMRLAHF